MQEPIHPANGPIDAKLNVPGSKNMSHQALLLGALADGVSEITNLHLGKHTLFLLNALRQLGIVTQLDTKERSCIIAGGGGKFPKKEASIWCDGTKALVQYFLTACSASPGVFYFDGAENLRQKSFTSLLDILRLQGAQIIPGNTSQLPFTLIGSDTIEGGEINLMKKEDHLLISALLITAPYARSPFYFNMIDSANLFDIEMTSCMMAEFGVLVHRIHQSLFMVPVPQRYQPKNLTIEADFSIAVYFFAAAALTCGKMIIQPTRYHQSKQVDVRFLAILEQMGCHIKDSSAGISLQGPKQLAGVDITLSVFSDTFLALAAIAPFAKSPVRIEHIGDMTKKERRYMHTIKTQLLKMNIHVETDEQWIKIFPGTPRPNIIDTDHDPHIAMAFSLIGLKIPGIIIDHAECVKNVIPEFYVLWKKITQHSSINA